jgi:hypothetical protein
LTSIKPFNVLNNQTEVEHPKPERNGQEVEEDTIVVNTSPTAPIKRGRGRPCKNANVIVFLQDDVQYKDSRQTEIAGLLEKGVFAVTSRTNMLKGVRIFNSRFINEIKNKGIKKELRKSRLVI